MPSTIRVGAIPAVRIAVIVLTLWLVSAPRPVHADEYGFGLRGGVSADPDQFVIGMHYDTGPIVDRLTFRPNAEVGFGDNLTLAVFNFEVAYWIPIKGHPWRLYVGGGPAMNVYVFDAHDGPGHGRDDTEVEPGFNLLFGVAHAGGVFFELKVGTIDSPDFKAMIGYSFGR